MLHFFDFLKRCRPLSASTVAKIHTFSGLACLFISLFPLFLNWGLNESSHFPEDSIPLYIGLKSSLYKNVVVAELTICVLCLLDNIVGHIVSPNLLTFDESLCRVLIVFSALLLDFTYLVWAIPNSNIRLFLIFSNCRHEIFLASMLSYLALHGGHVWKGILPILTLISIVIASILRSYRNFLPESVSSIISILGFIFYIIAFILYLWTNFRWYITVRGIQKEKCLSNAQYSVTLYAITFVCVCVGLIIILLLYGNKPYQLLDINIFIGHEVLYIFFFAVVQILQNQIFRREIRTYKSDLEFKRMFVSYISHEIRTPLSTVNMGLELLQDELEKIPNISDMSKLHNIVHDSIKSCETALSIVNDFLTFDKLEGGVLQLEMCELDVRAFITDTIQPFHVQATKQNITLRIFFESSGDVESGNILISADPHKLAQVVRNLVSNALKFTPPEGSVTVNVARAATEGRDDMLKVDVTDTGVGLSQEQQSRLFKEIIQFNPGKLQKGGGSGLGLYISNGIVELHRGKLSVFSDGSGHGSTFTLEMPCMRITTGIPKSSSRNSLLDSCSSRTSSKLNAPPSFSLDTRPAQMPVVGEVLEAAAASAYASRPPLDGDRPHFTHSSSAKVYKTSESKTIKSTRSVRPMVTSAMEEVPASRSIGGIASGGQHSETSPPGIMKALVVDDAELSRKMTRRVLETLSVDCEEAVDGAAAVAMVREGLEMPKHFSMVLIDYEMPHVNGPAAVKQMRELGFTGKIFGVTGHAEKSYVEEFLSHGADQVLLKPVNSRTLVALVDACMADTVRSRRVESI